jgi:hypothetical protein
LARVTPVPLADPIASWLLGALGSADAEQAAVVRLTRYSRIGFSASFEDHPKVNWRRVNGGIYQAAQKPQERTRVVSMQILIV